MSTTSIWKYRWFDTPNNEDGLKKAFALGKSAAKIGFALGAADMVTSDLMPKKGLYIEKALRVGAWMVPLVGMSTAFTVTQQVSLKVFPNMDQKFSFMFGGMSAAGVLGSWFRNGTMAFSACLVFGGAGFAYQYMREGRQSRHPKVAEFFMFFPDDPKYILYERHQDSTWFTNNYDWRRQHKERGHEVANIG